MRKSQEKVKNKAGITKRKNNLRNKRLKSLAKGRVKNLGPIEAIKLKIAGHIDGAGGLPRMIDDNHWNSPFMNREINSYEEFCSRIWGSLQLENEDSYSYLDGLIRNIQQTQVLLEEAKYNLSAATHFDPQTDAVRKKGEEHLTEAQVKSRRAAEREKRLAPLRSKVRALEDKLSAEMTELSELHSQLVEDENTTRIICHRVKAHTLQRLDLYWNAALKKHTDSGGMPAVLAIDLTFLAEQVYKEAHEKLMDQVETLHVRMEDKTTEKGVA